MKKCREVICCMDAFGTSNKKNQLLREEAEPDEKLKIN